MILFVIDLHMLTYKKQDFRGLCHNYLLKEQNVFYRQARL